MKVMLEQDLSPDKMSYEAKIAIHNTDRPDVIMIGIEGPEGFAYTRICRQRWLDLQEIVEVVFGAPGRAE